jgi:predicted NBD/HSP70 family sugar kinase
MMGVYVGLDIGGTKFMVAAADETGDELKRVFLSLLRWVWKKDCNCWIQ